MTLPTATELLTDWDASRPRSQQTEMGMSGLGGCRRAAGYTLQGYAPDPGFAGGGMQAIMGTAIHEALAEAGRQSVKLPPGACAEALEVCFAGLLGHPDLYAESVLRDYKTLGFAAQLERIRTNGPPAAHLWQASCYAAALILSGRPVTTIEIDYIDRSGGEEYLWSGPFEMQHVRDAMAWLEQVRTTRADRLSRDYRPDSVTCQGCPFFQRCWQSQAVAGRSARSALFADDPDAGAWAARLEAARAAKAAAEAAEADAKGALDALRTVERPGESEDITVPGFAKVIRFSVARGSEHLHRALIEEDYERAGAKPPMARSAPRITLSLVKGERKT